VVAKSNLPVLAATPSREFSRPERERVLGSSGAVTVATVVEVVVVVVVVGTPVDFASRVTERVNAASRSTKEA